MASETTRGRRNRSSSRPRRRNPGNSTAASKPARKNRHLPNSTIAGGGNGTRLPRELRRALEKQNAVKEKLGDSSLEAIRTEAQGPPRGYVFVPKGDVYITRNCRSLSHEAKQTVYTVYVSIITTY
ncbi:hypothetical protein ACJ73_07567 [Blastomyces percursus]|uniref:Uncharacterized protein n=1 Tax=Blastomyces percursus TaxID=1658174 RepID=A0A1J9PXM7_9EURO|nr:hypothetical protein ACJ73_07567 [Blastomyces percursus]